MAEKIEVAGGGRGEMPAACNDEPPGDVFES
jgi:hypothetical protein